MDRIRTTLRNLVFSNSGEISQNKTNSFLEQVTKNTARVIKESGEESIQGRWAADSDMTETEISQVRKNVALPNTLAMLIYAWGDSIDEKNFRPSVSNFIKTMETEKLDYEVQQPDDLNCISFNNKIKNLLLEKLPAEKAEEYQDLLHNLTGSSSHELLQQPSNYRETQNNILTWLHHQLVQQNPQVKGQSILNANNFKEDEEHLIGNDWEMNKFGAINSSLSQSMKILSSGQHVGDANESTMKWKIHSAYSSSMGMSLSGKGPFSAGKYSLEEVNDWLFNGKAHSHFPQSRLGKREQSKYAPKTSFDNVRMLGDGKYTSRIGIYSGGITDLRTKAGESAVIGTSNNGDLLTGCGFAVAKAVINAAGPGLQMDLYNHYGVPGVMEQPDYAKKHYAHTENRGYALTCDSHDLRLTHGIDAVELLAVPMESVEGLKNMYREALEHARSKDYIALPMAGMTHPVLIGNPELRAMGWTPPPETASDVPKWKCRATT